jgi:acyl-homoserine lactone acylase PvdQ
MRWGTACGVLAILATPAGAGAQDHSVSGTCSGIQGTARYGQPVTNAARDNTYDLSGTGVCDGTIDGSPVSGARVALHASGRFHGSCGSARSTAPGAGTLVWDRDTSDPGDDVTIAFTMEFTSVGTELDLILRGQRSGSARGRASFLTARAPPDVAIRCGGEGVTEIPFDASMSTDTPLVSGPPQQGTVSEGFMSVLAGGQGETVSAAEFATASASGGPPRTFVDQSPLYSAMIPLAPRLRMDRLGELFKPAGLTPAAGQSTASTTPRAGVRIVRDAFNVPFVDADSREDAMWGIGYAQAEDRLFFMDVLRHLGRGRLSELAGTGPDDRLLALDVNVLTQVDWSDEELQAQIDALPARWGAEGQRILDDLTAHAAGINAYIRRAQLDPAALPVEYAGVTRTPEPWSLVDSAAVLNLVTWIQSFLEGSEPLTAQALLEARHRFGRRRGARLVRDFRTATDPEGDTTIARRYRYPAPRRGRGRGIALPDLGSVKPRRVVVEGGGDSSAARARGAAQLGVPRGLPLPHGMSNALLVTARRSRTGRPLAVMGPQLGYWAPQIFWEFGVQAPGLQRRGAAIPGMPYTFVGRGRDWAWSLTSTLSDTVDTFAERLCEPDGSQPSLDSRHYVHRGRCVAFTERDVVMQTQPTALDPGAPPRRIVLRAQRTVHGTVQAQATVRGRPVVLVKADPSRGREVEALRVFRRLMDHDVDSASDFRRAVRGFTHKLNWYYAGPRSIAYVQSEPHPLRAPGVDLDLPMWGTGRWDWRGFDPATGRYSELPAHRLPRVTDPSSGAIVNWNNRAAPGWRQQELLQTGSVYRSELLSRPLRKQLRRKRRIDVARLVKIMGLAATTDLRGREVVPLLLRVVGRPRDRDTRLAVSLLRAWASDGSHRRDRDGDGTLEHSAAILLLDAWWEPLVRKMFKPVLGRKLIARLEALQPFSGRSALGDFGPGWWSYVDKDLRALLGRRVRGRLSRAYCGRGSLARCRASLRKSLRSTMAALRRAHGEDPQAWRIPTTCDTAAGERCDQIAFFPAGAVAPPPIPWQNRPTYQQVVGGG